MVNIDFTYSCSNIINIIKIQTKFSNKWLFDPLYTFIMQGSKRDL